MSSNIMQSPDDRVILGGYQHIYGWGSARQVYELLLRIKKAAESSDLSERETVVPNCRPFLISWSSVLKSSQVGVGEESFPKIHHADLQVSVKDSDDRYGTQRQWKGRAAFLNPDNEVVRPSEEFHLEEHHWSDSMKW
jgi:hypothetical protein